ncbi:MAG: hypothetical protein JW829_11645 [Pirellulales bacterium]|nr:hypothetical protein [Pirellulales bacterium]
MPGYNIVLGDPGSDPDATKLELNRFSSTTAENISLQEQDDLVLVDVKLDPNHVVTDATLFISSAEGDIFQDGSKFRDDQNNEPDGTLAQLNTITADIAAFRALSGAVILADAKFGTFAAEVGGFVDLDEMVISDPNHPDSKVNIYIDLHTINDRVETDYAPMTVVGGELVPLDVTNSLDAEYGIVLVNQGDIDITQVTDNTAANQSAISGILSSDGHVFIETLVIGNIDFVGYGVDSRDTVVSMQGDHIFTAVSAGNLIVHDDARLESSTGVVLDVSAFYTYDDSDVPPLPGVDQKIGPHHYLVAPQDLFIAPTNRLVGQEGYRFQQITLYVGTVGENNLIIQVVYDGNHEIAGIANTSLVPPPDIPPLAGLTFEPDHPTGNGDSFEFTVVVRHQFSISDLVDFGPLLETDIRVFNDPLINLFAQSGNTNLNHATSTLHAGLDDNFVLAQVQGPLGIPEEGTPPAPLPIYIPPPPVEVIPPANDIFELVNFDDYHTQPQPLAESARFGEVKEDEYLENYPEAWEGEIKISVLQDIIKKIKGEEKYNAGKYKIEVFYPNKEKKETYYTKDPLGESEDSENGNMLQRDEVQGEFDGRTEQYPVDRNATDSGWLEAWKVWNIPREFRSGNRGNIEAAVDVDNYDRTDSSTQDSSVETLATSTRPISHFTNCTRPDTGIQNRLLETPRASSLARHATTAAFLGGAVLMGKYAGTNGALIRRRRTVHQAFGEYPIPHSKKAELKR